MSDEGRVVDTSKYLQSVEQKWLHAERQAISYKILLDDADAELERLKRIISVSDQADALADGNETLGLPTGD